MRYNFDERIDRKQTNSSKYEDGVSINPYLPKEYLPLWIADMDFACAAPILEAMHRRLDRRILGYSSMVDPEYYASVVHWMLRRFGWIIQPEEITFSSGVVTALYAAVQILTKPEDAVLFMTPAYAPFDHAAKELGRKPLYNRLLENDGQYTLDFFDFEQKASQKNCKLCFLCSPQNPSGRVWTADELRRIGEICFANDVFVISDEIHADLTRIGVQHIPFGKVFPMEKRIITCTSPSKTFNIAGNRHANLIIPDAAIRDQFRHNAYCGHPGALAIDAAKAAYNDCEDWLGQLRVYLDENFLLLDTMLKNLLPAAVFHIPEGSYLAWVDLRALGLSEAELNQRVSSAGVFVQFGKDFVDNGDCHMRINLACPRSVLAEGICRICKVLRT
ncbi:MAG: PatB family C-S lyase [Clostridia bacterium]